MQSSDKKELRRRYLAARRGLDPATCAKLTEEIRTRLGKLPEFQNAPAVLTYIASKDNEVDTRPIIDDLLSRGQSVFVPITERGRMLRWSRLESLEEVAPAQFGILEPKIEFRRIVDPPPVGVVVVPGIVFALNGYRIGYGGGYFDRFLASYPGVKIGLAYDMQIVPALPHGPNDAPVNIIVTESRTVRCPTA